MTNMVNTETEFVDLNHIAIIDGDRKWAYRELNEAVQNMTSALLNRQPNLKGKCVAFMVNPGFDYVKTQRSIWRAGAIAVPLCLTHPLPSLQYVLEDTFAETIIISPDYKALLQDYCTSNNIDLWVLSESTTSSTTSLPTITPEDAAMILYTSGTTSKPKGVVLTHGNLAAQMNKLIQAWEWSSSDHILCVLPLHHIHGIVNVVGCSLKAGATCEFLAEFSPEKIIALFLKGEINVFMAVPTIYHKLIAYWETLNADEQLRLKSCMEKFRLMVCGSAALPATIMEKWKVISGHTLLERYGMTEIGMGISNPYHGERRTGFVGQPLPGVSVNLVDENYKTVKEGDAGEILIKGDNVFKQYWNKPEETSKAFTPDGWFKTGDVAIVEDGYYKIIGRNSVDIIKSGGYKISALEIEEVIRAYNEITDCAVVGIPDEEWGERVVAVYTANQELETDKLKSWLKTQMPSYKIPKNFLWLKELPRNAMGKIVKPELKNLFN